MTDLNTPLLTSDQLLAGWTPNRIGRRILTFAEVTSTNDIALEAADHPDADGLAVFADAQTAGRGRHRRAWLAPRGAGILCSVLLRDSIPPPAAPADIAGTLTLAAAVAVCEAIRRSTDVIPAIKWPNDVRVTGRKLAGILIESRALDNRTQAWIIGVGLNCHQQTGHFPPELRDSATSLEIVSRYPVDRAAVARELLRALDDALIDAGPERRSDIHARWLSYAEPLGQPVRLRTGGREYAGRTVAVDPDGGLIVQCDDGRRQWFNPQTTWSI